GPRGGAAVGQPRRIGTVPADAGDAVHTCSIEHVVGSVLAAYPDDVPTVLPDSDREEVRCRPEVEIVRIDRTGLPVPCRRTVEVKGDDRLLVRQRVPALPACGGRAEEQPSSRIDTRGRPGAAAAVTPAAEAAPRPAGEEPRRQPEVALAVVAVEAPHVVAGECVARRAGLDVEVPEEVTVVAVDPVEAALAVDPVLV